MRARRRPAPGFTLIELLIVVAIIGILAAIAVPNFLNAQIRAKVARVVSEERSLRDAYTQYFLDRNAWPPHIHGDAQHRYVTTPVPYLTTSVFCPFLNTHRGRLVEQWDPFRGQYHAEVASRWHDNVWPWLAQNEPAYWAEQHNTAFFLISLGPDLFFDQWKPSACRYNPSNGVLSGGDVLTPIPGGFQYQYPYINIPIPNGIGDSLGIFLQVRAHVYDDRTSLLSGCPV